jgi:hypothetical protein
MNQASDAATTSKAAIPDQPWFAEVWLAFRPYCVKLTIDFLIFVSIWAVLFAKQPDKHGNHPLVRG